MENLAGLLQQTKLLKKLSPDIIQQIIIPRGQIMTRPKGSYIIYELDRVDSVLILLSGRVSIVYSYADGSYSLAGVETAPRVLALDLIASKSRISPYYVLATEDSALFSFPARIILQPGELPETERQMLISELLIMISHLHTLKEKHLMILSRNGLRDRIMSYLSMQASWKRTASFTIPFSREEMAAYLCVNRTALSHELSLMRQEGLIDFSKNHFTLKTWILDDTGAPRI